MFRLFRPWFKSRVYAERSLPARLERPIRAALTLETLEERVVPTWTLTTGVGDGNATYYLDGFGSFGSSPVFSSPTFNPVGPGGNRSVAYASAVAIDVGATGTRTYLSTGGIYGYAGYLTTPDPAGTTTSAASSFTFGVLNFNLVQTLAPMFQGALQVGAMLTQTYTITNSSASAVTFELVRYHEAYIGGSYDGGGYLSGTTDTVFQTDNGGPPTNSQTFVAIQATGGTIPGTNRWAMGNYSMYSSIRTGAALPDAVELYYGANTDANGDNFVDSGYEYYTSAAMRNTFSIPAGGSDTYVATTITATAPPVSLVPGITVVQSGGTTSVREGGTADTYTVVLNTAPTADVIVTITPDAQISTSATRLTFTPLNYNTQQTITVTGVVDNIPEGTHNGVITAVASSVDTTYNGMPINNITATITEPGIQINTFGSVTVREGSTTDTYSIRLDTAPTSNVIVNVNPNAQLSVVPSTLTFTPANWNNYQNVTVAGVADGTPEGAHTGVVSHTSSGDPIYTGVALGNVTANITEPGLNFSGATSISVREGGSTDWYWIALDTAPPANVVITMTPDSQVSVSPAFLTFTTANWSSYQQVTVTGLLDATPEGAHTGMITHSGDGIYAGVSLASVTANITEPGLNIFGTPITVAEGGTGSTLWIRLDTAPPGNVLITLTPDAFVNVSTTILTYTPANWNFNQFVTVTGVQNGTPEGTHTGVISFAGDGIYANSILAPITATVNEPGVFITLTGGSNDIKEGGNTDTFRVRLDTMPATPVMITLTPDAQQTLDVTVLTFDSANWATNQIVTMTAVADGSPEGMHTGSITFSGSGDPLYVGVALPVITANIIEPGINIAESGGSTTMTEGGTGDTYTVTLDTAPASNVVVTVSPDAQGTASPTTLTFTPATWNVAQTVTVTAIADGATEAIHTGIFSHSSSGDAIYTGVGLASLTATVYEPGVFVEESGGVTNVNEDGTGPIERFRVQLTSQPVANVTVTLAADPQLTINVTTMTFTPATWNVFQYVIVTAVDDGLFQGNRTANITSTVASTDPAYLTVTARTVTANIIDNELPPVPPPPPPPPGVTLVQTVGTTNIVEGGADDTYTLVLDAAPTQDVFITLTPDSQVSLSAPVLTFTTVNWNFPQTVTVTAVDDVITEPLLHSGFIATTVTSVDASYNGMGVPTVTAFITDNDNPAVNLVAGAINVAEGSATPGSYTIALNTQPLSNVVITITPDAQVSVTPTAVTFTGTNWNRPQTIAVRSVDDGQAELSPHFGIISHAATSGDGNYNGITINDATASITDDDIPGATLFLAGGGLTILEGSTSDSYTIVLKTQPAADVMVIPTAGSDLAANTPALTFTSANWNIPQKVTVNAPTNITAQGTHTDTISNITSSTDLAYNNLNLGTVTATIVDVEGGSAISGTSKADQIVAAPSTIRAGDYVVTVNGKSTVVNSTVTQLVLFGGDGNDSIQVIDPPVPVVIVGGAGTDKMFVTGKKTSANTFDLGSYRVLLNSVKVSYWQVESMIANGGTGDDTFNVSDVPLFATELKADAGNDTLIGPGTASTFKITAANAGTLNTRLKFTAVENITGGASADTFQFAAGQKISGKIDGGAGANILDYSLYATPVAVNLQASTGTGIGTTHAGFTTIKGGKSTADRLIGPDTSNLWSVTATNAGNVNSATFFQAFENLTGGLFDDTFRLNDGVGIKGKIDGGQGADILDYSNYNTRAVALNLQTKVATNVGGFLNLEQFLSGNTSSDTIIAPNAINVWNINGAGAGTVAGFSFQYFENLSGGTLADTFNMDAGGDWLGTLNGGTGSDLLTAYSGQTNTYVTTSPTAGTLNTRKYMGIETHR